MSVDQDSGMVDGLSDEVKEAIDDLRRRQFRINCVVAGCDKRADGWICIAVQFPDYDTFVVYGDVDNGAVRLACCTEHMALAERRKHVSWVWVGEQGL